MAKKPFTYKQWQERVTITENEWGVERERVKKIPLGFVGTLCVCQLTGMSAN